MSIYQLLTESRIDAVKRKYSNLTDEDVTKIVAMDPTDSKKYIMWIAREYKSNDMQAPVVRQLLINWENNVNRLNFDLLSDFDIHYGFKSKVQPTKVNYKDIYTYSFEDVVTLTEYMEHIPTRSEIKDIVKSETKKIFEGNLDGYDVLVIQPLSYQSSCHYGATTKWCTASKKTKSNYSSYTSRGELFYIIFKDQDYLNKENGLPIFKYAIYFKIDDENPEIYDQKDELLPSDKFFEKFPGIKKVFKDKLPLTSYEILQILADKKQKKDNDRIFTLLKKLDFLQDGNLDDKAVGLAKQGKIKIYLQEDFIENTFADEESSGIVSQAISGYHADNYSRDSYIDNEEFAEGYIFRHFDNDVWERLIDYFTYTNTQAVVIIKKIIAGKDINVLDKLYQELVGIFDDGIHNKLRDDIIESYGHAMETAINEQADKDIKTDIGSEITSFFKHICKDPFELNGISSIITSSIIISIQDVLRWYQDGDNPLPDGSRKMTKTIYDMLRRLNEDGNYAVSNAYEYYSGGEYNSDVFNSEFNIITTLIDKRIDDIELDPDIVENMEKMLAEIEKLKSIGINIGSTYNTPGKKYSLTIEQANNEDVNFLVTVRDIKTNKSKRVYLTADRIINLLKMRSAFNLIDEIYSVFNKITR